MSAADQFPATNTKTEYFPMAGGLDLMTPHLSITPGSCLDIMNYEPGIYGGYRQVDGFERYDGRPSPSKQTYNMIPIVLTGAIAVGDTITGATSGATALVIQVNASELVTTKNVGLLIDGEDITVGGITQATADGPEISSSATSLQLDAAYKCLAADIYRADIQAVPGSGPVRGVWLYNDTIYAFRDNVGATAGAMFKATSSGWVQISLGFELAFSAGTAAINDGDTVLGDTSGATGIVKRVMLQTGAWGAGATGKLVFASITGTFQAGEALKVGGVSKATGGGAQSAITLAPGGRYEFVNYNFTASLSTYRMYGCNGVSRAFEFDGTTFCPLNTGMASDTPAYIAAHKGMLFLTFGGSLQHSAVGFPYQWSVVLGAGEIGLGDSITGLLPQPGSSSTNAIVVFTRHQTYILYGSSSADWNLVNYTLDTGAVPYTAQQIGSPFFMDDRGLVRLSTTQQYGNFEQATVSRKIQPLLEMARGHVTATSVVRAKNQMRIYLDNGELIVVTITIGQTQLGVLASSYAYTRMNYGIPVRCVCSCPMSDGTEAVFFGSDNGYVYQADKGFTMDGEAIQRWIRLPFNHLKSPRVRKRYRKAVFEMTAEGSATIALNADYSYGDLDLAINQQQQSIVAGSLGGVWDVSLWDQFYWDSSVGLVSVPEVGLTGTGTNISLLVYSDTKEPSHTLQGVILHYTPRRISR